MNYYNRPPLKTVDGIPVFSEQDDYVENYVEIASDHIAAINENSENPWIEADVWEEMELGTLNHVLDHLKSSGDDVKILDVGVGLGRLLERIKSNHTGGLQLHGIDISLPYLQVAHFKGLNVAMAKIEDMPYTSNYFDIITCTDVLEHVYDLNLCVGKIINCLKPGGVLIVRVPNREDLSSYLKPDYPYQMAHLRGFDEYSLELMFTKIFKLEFVAKSPGLLVRSNSLLKYRLPLRGYNFVINSFLRLIKFFSIRTYNRFISKLYHPAEINAVLRKPV